MIQSYKDLIVWQKAMQMAEMLYSMVKKFPKEETYAYELETQLMLTVRIGYATEQEISPLMNLLTEIGKIINTMISKLKTNP